MRSFAAILGATAAASAASSSASHHHHHHRRHYFYGASVRDEEDEQMSVLGELMYQSDAGYVRLGLGSDGTDEIVRLTRRLGPERGVFGAKITGGGSGGTVCVLGRGDDGSGEAAVEEICGEYERLTGRKPYVFRGSSPGAVAFDHLRLKVLPSSS